MEDKLWPKYQHQWMSWLKKDAEEFLCSLTNGQTHCVWVQHPFWSCLLSVMWGTKELIFTPFFLKGVSPAKCWSFNVSDKNIVQRKYVYLRSTLSQISPPPVTTWRKEPNSVLSKCHHEDVNICMASNSGCSYANTCQNCVTNTHI